MTYFLSLDRRGIGCTDLHSGHLAANRLAGRDGHSTHLLTGLSARSECHDVYCGHWHWHKYNVSNRGKEPRKL